LSISSPQTINPATFLPSRYKQSSTPAMAAMSITGFLACLAYVFFALRIGFFCHDISRFVRGRCGSFLVNFFNVCIAFILFIISIGAFDDSEETSILRHTCQQVDGAFGGLGTRIALWLNVGLILLQWVIGLWVDAYIGSRNMACGMLMGHASIAVCLLIQLRYGTLSFTDAVIGSMVLDVQGSSLLNQLAMKDTMVSPFMVGAILITVFSSLITISVFIGTAMKSTPNPCVINYYNEIQAGGPVPNLLWLYFAIRMMSYVTAAFRAIQCVHDIYAVPLEVDEVEMTETGKTTELVQPEPTFKFLSFNLKGNWITARRGTKEDRLRQRLKIWTSSHNTIGSFGAENFVFAISTMLSYERAVQIVGHDDMDMLGQQMAVMITIVSIASAMYCGFRLMGWPKCFWDMSPLLGERRDVECVDKIASQQVAIREKEKENEEKVHMVAIDPPNSGISEVNVVGLQPRSSDDCHSGTTFVASESPRV